MLLEKGVKVKDIAEQYCVTSGAVYAFMKSHHIQRPKVMKEKTKEPVICTEAIAKKCYYGGKTGGYYGCRGKTEMGDKDTGQDHLCGIHGSTGGRSGNTST